MNFNYIYSYVLKFWINPYNSFWYMKTQIRNLVLLCTDIIGYIFFFVNITNFLLIDMIREIFEDKSKCIKTVFKKFL